jgi:hypothetical protein
MLSTPPGLRQDSSTQALESHVIAEKDAPLGIAALPAPPQPRGPPPRAARFRSHSRSFQGQSTHTEEILPLVCSRGAWHGLQSQPPLEGGLWSGPWCTHLLTGPTRRRCRPHPSLRPPTQRPRRREGGAGPGAGHTPGQAPPPASPFRPAWLVPPHLPGALSLAQQPKPPKSASCRPCCQVDLRILEPVLLGRLSKTPSL